MHRCLLEPWKTREKSNTIGLAMVGVIFSRFRHQRQWVLPLLQPWTQLDDGSLSNADKGRRKGTTEEEQNGFFFLFSQRPNIYIYIYIYMKRSFSLSSLLSKIKKGRCEERIIISFFPFDGAETRKKKVKTPLSLSLSLSFIFLFFLFPLSVS